MTRWYKHRKVYISPICSVALKFISFVQFMLKNSMLKWGLGNVNVSRAWIHRVKLLGIGVFLFCGCGTRLNDLFNLKTGSKQRCSQLYWLQFIITIIADLSDCWVDYTLTTQLARVQDMTFVLCLESFNFPKLILNSLTECIKH